jgi:hypothetical protein
VKAIPTKVAQKVKKLHSEGKTIIEIKDKLNIPLWMVSRAIGEKRTKRSYEALVKQGAEKIGYFDVSSQTNWLVTE